MDGKELRWTLSAHPFDIPVRYNAFSYTWGTAPASESMISAFDTHAEATQLFVTPTLLAALTTMAKKEKNTLLWIDTICIHQNDTWEKNDQVSMMHKIYASAIFVAVWLGQRECQSDLAMYTLHWLAEL